MKALFVGGPKHGEVCEIPDRTIRFRTLDGKHTYHRRMVNGARVMVHHDFLPARPEFDAAHDCCGCNCYKPKFYVNPFEPKESDDDAA